MIQTYLLSLIYLSHLLYGETKSVTDSQGNVTYFKVESGSNPMARILNGSHKVTACGMQLGMFHFI